MMEKEKNLKASDLFKQIAELGVASENDDENSKKEISLDELTKILKDKGFGILMLICSFPMAIPLPYPPGFTTILGIPLMLFSIQMLLGYEAPKLPRWIGRKSFKIKSMRDSINKAMPYILKIEKYIKPRFLQMTTISAEKFVGAISLLCAIFITLPIMFGNAVPSAGILVMSLGLISKDGITVLLGILISIIGIIIASIFGFLIFVVSTKFVFQQISSWIT